MSIVRLYSGKGTGTYGPAATFYLAAWNGFEGGTAATSAFFGQYAVRTPGTYSNMYMNVFSNSLTANTVRTFQVAGVNGNQVITVPSSTTGEFEDITNTDVVAAGILVNNKIITGGTGSTILDLSTAMDFNSAGLATSVSGTTASAFLPSVGGTTYLFPVGGTATTASLGNEASLQKKLFSATAWKNLFVYATTNTRNNNTTVTSRIAGVNGNCNVIYGAGITGIIEDISNVDNIPANTLVCGAAILAAGGSGTFTMNVAKFDEVTTDNTYSIAGNPGSTGTVINANTTAYNQISGTVAQVPTESESQNRSGRISPGYPKQFQNLGVYCNANANTGNSIFTFRKNATNSALTVTFASGVTGRVEDTTHVVQTINTDEIDTGIVTGTTGSTITVNSIYYQAVVQNPTFIPFS